MNVFFALKDLNFLLLSLNLSLTTVFAPVLVFRLASFLSYEGDPRSNANTSVISSTFGISKNGLHVYHDILSIL